MRGAHHPDDLQHGPVGLCRHVRSARSVSIHRVAKLEVAAPAGTVVLEGEVDQVLVGDRLLDAGQYELALRAYYRAAAERGLDAEVLTSIGSANLRLGRIGQAERQFRDALDVDETFIPRMEQSGRGPDGARGIRRGAARLSTGLRAR